MAVREQYGLIRLWSKMLDDNGFGDMAKAKETLDEMKRDLRKSLKKDESDPQCRVFHEDGYGFYVRKPLPEYIETMDEAEEYFEEEERVHMIHYPWDCTGQLFTAFHWIFKVNGRFILYHRIDLDI